MSNDLTPIVDRELKEAWVAALRSGNYRQGQGQLHSTYDGDEEDRFCCLGVLCHLLAERGELIAETVERGTVRYADPASTGDFASGYLPHVVRQRLGWESQPRPDDDPDDRISKEERRLATLNDNHRSFDDIANIIERL